MWGHVNTDRTPALLGTCTLASGHMGLRPADYDSGTLGAMSALTGARLPQDPLEDSGGAVGGHVHIRGDSSEPHPPAAGPVGFGGPGRPGASVTRCSCPLWGHAQPPRPPWGSLDGLLPSEARAASPVPRAGGLLGVRHRPPGPPAPGPAPCPPGGPAQPHPPDEPGPTPGP
ncbi:unnamed protein product [Nyctereutes procyonoides]|uniref:(raccoon dog) hypothetical protein n=1 Tax=Nyctereutes procyonoides TaxID=34880 RepID=A0A811ZQC7_NYCPR|nr:unnamed protein product [Nyctereutes procyonoides]